jgi:hypothetical protein
MTMLRSDTYAHSKVARVLLKLLDNRGHFDGFKPGSKYEEDIIHDSRIIACSPHCLHTYPESVPMARLQIRQ